MEKTRFTVSFTDPNYQWLSQHEDSTGQGITEVVNETIAERRLLQPSVKRLEQLVDVAGRAWFTLAKLTQENKLIWTQDGLEEYQSATRSINSL